MICAKHALKGRQGGQRVLQSRLLAGLLFENASHQRLQLSVPSSGSHSTAAAAAARLPLQDESAQEALGSRGAMGICRTKEISFLFGASPSIF